MREGQHGGVVARYSSDGGGLPPLPDGWRCEVRGRRGGEGGTPGAEGSAGQRERQRQLGLVAANGTSAQEMRGVRRAPDCCLASGDSGSPAGGLFRPKLTLLSLTIPLLW